MVRSLARLVSGTALAIGLSFAIPQAASAQPTSLRYTIAIKQVYGSQYPITGQLDLQQFPAGNIRGYYHSSFNKLFVPVVGGRDGDYIWLDIGPSSSDLGLGAGPNGKLHVVGTVAGDGSVSGQVYPETADVLTEAPTTGFFATPDPSVNDQYVFTATPATTDQNVATPQP